MFRGASRGSHRCPPLPESFTLKGVSLNTATTHRDGAGSFRSAQDHSKYINANKDPSGHNAAAKRAHLFSSRPTTHSPIPLTTSRPMDAPLRSDNITLVSDYRLWGCANEMWPEFRRTAVEPCQASASDFLSFANECLLCAHIVVNSNIPAGTQGRRGNNQPRRCTRRSSMEGYAHASPPPLFPTSTDPFSLPDPADRQVGFVYLYAGSANFPAGEANIGVIIKQDEQRRGYAREAVQLVLRWAFEDLSFHRVQAAILDTPFKDRALRLFIGSGFAHEGTKRRAVYQSEGEGVAGVWKDVTYLAMLDTEWMLKSTSKQKNQVPEQPVVTAWDEMFLRHSREREELLRWEESHGRTKRSSSVETLRENTRDAELESVYLTDDTSSVGEPSLSGSQPPSPRPNMVVAWEDGMDMADEHGTKFGQGWEEVVQSSIVARRERQDMEDSLLGPTPRGHALTLPSIPSARTSEVNPQSPLTIPTPSTPGTWPPPSPSPSAPSSAYDSSDFEDEDDWLHRGMSPPVDISAQSTIPRDRYSRARSARSSSSSSTDSWSDAQSSIGSSFSHWDMLD